MSRPGLAKVPTWRLSSVLRTGSFLVALGSLGPISRLLMRQVRAVDGRLHQVRFEDPVYLPKGEKHGVHGKIA